MAVRGGKLRSDEALGLHVVESQRLAWRRLQRVALGVAVVAILGHSGLTYCGPALALQNTPAEPNGWFVVSSVDGIGSEVSSDDDDWDWEVHHTVPVKYASLGGWCKLIVWWNNEWWLDVIAYVVLISALVAVISTIWLLCMGGESNYGSKQRSAGRVLSAAQRRLLGLAQNPSKFNEEEENSSAVDTAPDGKHQTTKQSKEKHQGTGTPLHQSSRNFSSNASSTPRTPLKYSTPNESASQSGGNRFGTGNELRRRRGDDVAHSGRRSGPSATPRTGPRNSTPLGQHSRLPHESIGMSTPQSTTARFPSSASSQPTRNFAESTQQLGNSPFSQGVNFQSPLVGRSQFGTPGQSPFVGTPGQSQFGTPGQSQFGTPGRSQFGTPGQSRFGTPSRPQFGTPGQSQFGGTPGQSQFSGTPGQSQFGGTPGQSPFAKSPFTPNASKARGHGSPVPFGIPGATNNLPTATRAFSPFTGTPSQRGNERDQTGFHGAPVHYGTPGPARDFGRNTNVPTGPQDSLVMPFSENASSRKENILREIAEADLVENDRAASTLLYDLPVDGNLVSSKRFSSTSLSSRKKRTVFDSIDDWSENVIKVLCQHVREQIVDALIKNSEAIAALPGNFFSKEVLDSSFSEVKSHGQVPQLDIARRQAEQAYKQEAAPPQAAPTGLFGGASGQAAQQQQKAAEAQHALSTLNRLFEERERIERSLNFMVDRGHYPMMDILERLKSLFGYSNRALRQGLEKYSWENPTQPMDADLLIHVACDYLDRILTVADQKHSFEELHLRFREGSSSRPLNSQIRESFLSIYTPNSTEKESKSDRFWGFERSLVPGPDGYSSLPHFNVVVQGNLWHVRSGKHNAIQAIALLMYSIKCERVRGSELLNAVFGSP